MSRRPPTKKTGSRTDGQNKQTKFTHIARSPSAVPKRSIRAREYKYVIKQLSHFSRVLLDSATTRIMYFYVTSAVANHAVGVREFVADCSTIVIVTFLSRRSSSADGIRNGDDDNTIRKRRVEDSDSFSRDKIRVVFDSRNVKRAPRSCRVVCLFKCLALC